MSRIRSANLDRAGHEKLSSQVRRTRTDAQLSYHEICSRQTVAPVLVREIGRRKLINFRIGDLVKLSILLRYLVKLSNSILLEYLVKLWPSLDEKI